MISVRDTFVLRVADAQQMKRPLLHLFAEADHHRRRRMHAEP